HVFNFDVPVHAEDYVHRIGRTGRAGRSGAAFTLVAPADGKHLDAILKLIQRDVEWVEAAPVAQESEEPKTPSRSRRGATRRQDGKAERAPAETAKPEKQKR